MKAGGLRNEKEVPRSRTVERMFARKTSRVPLNTRRKIVAPSIAPPDPTCVNVVMFGFALHAAERHCTYVPASKRSGLGAPMCSASSACAALGTFWKTTSVATSV